MRTLLFLFLAPLPLAVSVAAQTPQYTIHDLGLLPCCTSGVTGINTQGQVVGYATNNGQVHAFRTAPSAPIDWTTDDLGTLGGATSQAYGINASGQVVGSSVTGTGQTHAFRTGPNAPIQSADDLGTLGGASSSAFGINTAGQVTGTSDTAVVTNSAFRTAANAAINPATDNIGSLLVTPYTSGDSRGLSINTHGDVEGEFMPSNIGGAPYPTGFFYSNGVMNELPFVRAPFMFFTNTNDQNQIAFNGGALEIWQGGTIMTLSDCDCIPFRINNVGQIVGISSRSVPFLYTGGTAFPLLSIVAGPAGWQLQFVSDINDQGQIVGYGTLNGERHGYRLDPVMTPQQAISQLGGLIDSYQLGKGRTTALNSPLQAAIVALQAGDTADARSELNAFEHMLRAQSGKSLSYDQANTLLAAAESVIAILW